MKLYSNNINNLFSNAALITADLAKVSVELVVLTPEEVQSKEIKAKNLTGKYPFLETADGNLNESAAIARFFASHGDGQKLLGGNEFEKAQVNQWIDFTSGTVYPQGFSVYRGVFGWPGADTDIFNDSLKALKEAAKTINTHLQGKEYLVGKSVTVADIVLFQGLSLAFQTVFDGGFRKAMPNINGWWERIAKLPEVVNRVGNTKASAKAIKPTLPAKEKPVAVDKPQAAAKKTEDGEEAPKKDVDPLDELDKTNPSKLNLYDYKTFFVNHPDKKGEGVQFFFDNYVPGEYTVYHIQYEKYPGEGEVLYQTLNLMNGFLQRIDHFRKHVLAMHATLGDEPNLNVEGVWLFRGQGVPQQMIDHPQFEYYKKRELDISKEEDRNLIKDFWGAKTGDVINGQKVQECKMHK